MALKEVIYLSSEQYDTLSSTGTITIDGVTLTYDPDSYIYFTPEEEGSGLPGYDSSKASYVLSIDSSGNLIWKAPYGGAASGS